MNTRTAPLPPVDLTDPIWTVEHAAAALRLGPRATRTVVATTGFPTPFRLNDAPTARLDWVRDDVLAHFAALTSGLAELAALPTARELAR